VYTLGATGLLNALNAGDGKLIWSRNAAEDANVKVLTWGFCGSPVVAGDLVIISLAGKLAAFNAFTGEPAWFGNDGGSGYSSPHLLTICNVPQVVLMSEAGAVSVEPETGKELWNYPWHISDRILQPAWLGKDELLLIEENKNVRRIRITLDAAGWKTSDIWTSPEIRMLYNDFVIHKGFAYGFDGPSMACIDLNDGKRMWRGARYRGFQVLLADQDLILVLSEKGELALVRADPERFTELSKILVLKEKTWNHPAVAGNILIVRNSEEMAAYRLPVK
jgi:outer membrane protein assembly factor BamB